MPDSPIRVVLAAALPGPGAAAVLRSAALVAERSGAALHLVHALEGERWAEGGPTGRQAERVEEVRRELRRAADDALGPGAAAEIHVEAGRAHRAVLRRAEEIGAELLVVGANRSGTLQAHFLGSTAERVLHGAGAPVLVVKEALRLPLRSVAVPTDAREPSVGAVAAAIAWSLRLADGGSPAPVRLVYAGWEVEAADDPSLEARVIRPALEAAAERAAAGAGAVPRSVEVAWGTDPAGVIARWAEREAPGLLVMASHGATGVRRLVTGSVAQSVARQAPVPVLLLPPERWEAGEDGGAGA